MEFAVVVIVGLILGVLMGTCREKSKWKRLIDNGSLPNPKVKGFYHRHDCMNP